jgi:hypothetical protein
MHDWQEVDRATNFMIIKSKIFQSQIDDCRIGKDDLKRLAQVSEVLTLLNDPYIGPFKLADCIQGLPVLAARCRREAALHRPRNEVEDIERALNVLGNRGIEKVLLELLEDMTILKSEIEDSSSSLAPTNAPAAQAPVPENRKPNPASVANKPRYGSKPTHKK